jgi:hypothetical protein
VATLHNDYAPDGVKQPAFPGGTVSNHSWNGGLETAYGIAGDRFDEASALEFGAGFGLHDTSDGLVLKLILNRSF